MLPGYDKRIKIISGAEGVERGAWARMGRKATVYTEIAFVFANMLLGLGVAMLAASGLGMTMTGTPAYLLSIRFPQISLGLWDLLVQILLILLTFAVIGKVRWSYLLSLLSGSLYAVFLDLWRAAVPVLDPGARPEALPLAARLLMFLLGMTLVMFAVAVFLRCYLLPQSYDLFVKELSRAARIPILRVKTVFDCSFLLVGLLLSLLMFSEVRAVGIGTVLMALTGGSILNAWDRFLAGRVDFVPLFRRAVPLFEA